QRPPSPEDADMGAEELVRGTREKITTPTRNVDRGMRREMHGIQEHQGADFMSQSRDLAHGIARADCVGSAAEGHKFRSRRQLPFEVVEIERAIFSMNINALDRGPAVPSGPHPRRHICVMVEARHYDLVARLPAHGDRTTDGKSQRGHVGPKYDR